MADGRLRHTASTDILFPEPPEEPPPPYQDTPPQYGSHQYLPGYPREAQYPPGRPQYPRSRYGLAHYPPPPPGTAPDPPRLRKVDALRPRDLPQPPHPEEIYSQPATVWSQRHDNHHTAVKTPHHAPAEPRHQFPSPSVVEAASRYNYLASLKRRTWSPPTFERVMGAASSMHAMRSYRSNDQLDVDTENHYEDLESVTGAGGPPRIAPVSGRLPKSPHKSLIKPIAFKPIVPAAVNSRYASTPAHSPASSHHSQQQQQQQLPQQPQPLTPRTLPPPHHRQPPYGGGPPQRHHSHDGHYSPAVLGGRGGYPQPEHTVSPPQRQHSYDVTTAGTTSMRTGSHSQDDGYISQEYGTQSHSHSNSNASAGSLQLDTSDRSIMSYTSSHHSDHFLPHHQSPPHAATGNHGGHQSGHHHRSPASSEHHHHRSERPESFTSSNLSRVSSSHHGCGDGGGGGGVYGMLQTPSPSDSGVGELEAMLRDKDAEIQKLRETMEKNETAILQVYKERKENYEMEIREINAEWDRRMRFQQQKAFKTEQGLLMQLYKVQQERKTLRASCDQVHVERDALQRQCSDAAAECQSLKDKMEETQWEMCQKSGEISLLKQQIKDVKDELSAKSTELIGAKSQLREAHADKSASDDVITALRREKDELLQDALDAKLQAERAQSDLISVQSDHAKCRPHNNNNNHLLLSSSSSGSGGGSQEEAAEQLAAKHEDLEKMRLELEKVKYDLEASRADFEQEREQWLDEKNKVIRYQKHLQLNYVQMYRKNRMLEAEVEQLTLELETRDIQLSSEGGNHLNEEESMC